MFTRRPGWHSSYLGDLSNLMVVEALKATPKKSLYKDELGTAVSLEGVALGNRLKPLVKAGVVTVEAKKVSLSDDADAVARVWTPCLLLVKTIPTSGDTIDTGFRG